MDIHSTVSIVSDAETDFLDYVNGEWYYNPEYISQTLLNRKVPLINSLVDLYISTIRSTTYTRSNSVTYSQYCMDTYGLEELEELLSIGKQKGYLNYSLEEINNGKMDTKTQELFEAFTIDNDQLQSSCTVETAWDWSNMKIVYNGKYYEGENSIFEFMFDYFNIDGTSYNSKLDSLYNHLFEIALE